MDWGSIPDWVGAVLNSGALGLALYILLRDRRKEERSEANLVVCWRTWSNDAYSTSIHNAGQRAVVDVSVLVNVRDHANGPITGYETFPGPAVMRSGEEVQVETPRGHIGNRMTPRFVTFQDADGLFWIRDLPTGDLRRLPARSTAESAISQYRKLQRQALKSSTRKVVESGRSEVE